MQHASERVLFVSPVEPWCRENGHSVIIADMLEALATVGGAEVFPVFLRNPPAADCPPGPARLRGVTLGVGGLPKWLSVAGSLLTARSPLRVRFANRHVARRVIRAVRARDFSPTLVHVEALPVVDIGLHLAREFRCPLVYRAHNIESRLWSRTLAEGGLLRTWLLRYLERLEVDAIASAQLTLCISGVDLAWVRSRAPAARAELLPGCLLFSRYERDREQAAAGEPQICFVGGLEWRPNEIGLRWFVDEVLPEIVEQVPGARLVVLARGAEARPWLTQNAAVHIMPGSTVPASLFASSRASIAPLLQGGGVRIKILESLALGCPVVATGIGGEGLDLPGLTSTDVPTLFAERCVRHLRHAPDRETRRALAEGVRLEHGAEVVAGRLVAAWSMLRASHSV